MICSDTGKTQVVHLSHLTLGEAQDIDAIKGAIMTYGHGEGQITLPVRNGSIPVIDWMVRKFRTRKRPSA